MVALVSGQVNEAELTPRGSASMRGCVGAWKTRELAESRGCAKRLQCGKANQRPVVGTRVCASTMPRDPCRLMTHQVGGDQATH